MVGGFFAAVTSSANLFEGGRKRIFFAIAPRCMRCPTGARSGKSAGEIFAVCKEREKNFGFILS